MEKNEYSKVRAIEVEAPKTVSELLYSMSNTGFQGRSLARVAEVYERMIKAPETGILFGYAGSLSTTGQWKVINWLIENRYIDILVSTGANITEDIVEAMGRSYWQGIPTADDEMLFREGINRYYDVYGLETDYLEMTEMIAEFIVTLDESYNYSSKEFLRLFGKWLGDRGKEHRYGGGQLRRARLLPGHCRQPLRRRGTYCEGQGLFPHHRRHERLC